MSTGLTQLFEQAVADSKNLPSKPGNDILLQLYALYKQATGGDAPDESTANPFDFVAKAKFEAWATLKGKTKEDAMQEYADQVNELKTE
jgi:diazepam-binding inhibitor (GABA receptor modulating acyl-CoA-binding protein)